MADREKVIRAVDSCFNYWLEQHRCLNPLELENVRQFKADAISILKEQELKEQCLKTKCVICPHCYNCDVDEMGQIKEQENLKQKMWNALYAEEDDLEEKFIGTEKRNDWFFVYRPWLQRGFEIAIQVIAEQEGM